MITENGDPSLFQMMMEWKKKQKRKLYEHLELIVKKPKKRKNNSLQTPDISL